jgi:hypothetical protein
MSSTALLQSPPIRRRARWPPGPATICSRSDSRPISSGPSGRRELAGRRSTEARCSSHSSRSRPLKPKRTLSSTRRILRVSAPAAFPGASRRPGSIRMRRSLRRWPASGNTADTASRTPSSTTSCDSTCPVARGPPRSGTCAVDDLLLSRLSKLSLLLARLRALLQRALACARRPFARPLSPDPQRDNRPGRPRGRRPMGRDARAAADKGVRGCPAQRQGRGRHRPADLRQAQEGAGQACNAQAHGLAEQGSSLTRAAYRSRLGARRPDPGL